MPDPFTLATVSASVLPHLVKFVFEQAGKLLARRRSTTSGENTDVLETQTLAELEQSAQFLREYAVGGRPSRTTDRELLDAVDAARKQIESLTGTPLDLAAGLKQRGVDVEIEKLDVDGVTTGIKATAITDKANVSVKFSDSVVRSSGEFTAIELNGPIG
ncbi:hypothetical protein JNUCC0626_48295 [Lentzea sp. JNUCC 0626]|uniref:hypothetical protein n=1 Tax=Lentzea sp. JNUCC 0626 TaxID=3367513 RepID=UPI003748D2D0